VLLQVRQSKIIFFLTEKTGKTKNRNRSRPKTDICAKKTIPIPTPTKVKKSRPQGSIIDLALHGPIPKINLRVAAPYEVRHVMTPAARAALQGHAWLLWCPCGDGAVFVGLCSELRYYLKYLIVSF
jgi:hypothetical protein